ncbi:DNA gyrase subunit b, putative, partial [Eimeria tenella]
MYIGDKESEGISNLIFEVLQNAVDEIPGGCKSVEVHFYEDNSISVQDDGRGIPCDFIKTKSSASVSALEVVLTTLHSGGKFAAAAAPAAAAAAAAAAAEGPYSCSGGLHGVGLPVVNALSSRLRVEVLRWPYLYSIECSRGKVIKPFEAINLEQQQQQQQQAAAAAAADWRGHWPAAARQGTFVRYKADEEIFSKGEINEKEINENKNKIKNKNEISKVAARLKDLSFLFPGISFRLSVEAAAADAAAAAAAADTAAADTAAKQQQQQEDCCCCCRALEAAQQQQQQEGAEEKKEAKRSKKEKEKSEKEIKICSISFESQKGLKEMLQQITKNSKPLFGEVPIISVVSSNSELSLEAHFMFVDTTSSSSSSSSKSSSSSSKDTNPSGASVAATTSTSSSSSNSSSSNSNSSSSSSCL